MLEDSQACRWRICLAAQDVDLLATMAVRTEGPSGGRQMMGVDEMDGYAQRQSAAVGGCVNTCGRGVRCGSDRSHVRPLRDA